MRTRTAALAAVTAAALALAPVASASAAKPDAKPKKAKTGISVTKLSIAGKKTIDVAEKDAVVKVRVQVKDRSKTFDPASVRLKIVEKVTGEENETLVVKAKLAGKSKKVSNWVGKVTVPQGSVAPGTTTTYCVKLVKVVLDEAGELPVSEKAKGLKGRDCVTIVNTATA